jgi:hypothetical protein
MIGKTDQSMTARLAPIWLMVILLVSGVCLGTLITGGATWSCQTQKVLLPAAYAHALQVTAYGLILQSMHYG